MNVWYFAIATAVVSAVNAAAPNKLNYECNEWSESTQSGLQAQSQYRVRWDGVRFKADHDGNGFAMDDKIAKAKDISRNNDPEVRAYSFISAPTVDFFNEAVIQRYLFEVWPNSNEIKTPIERAYPYQIRVTRTTQNQDGFLIYSESYLGNYCKSR
ncbi:hypothetical protein [Achromobacter animicus]|uniref:hypothetical protein n=1 Tax=Achromobacter animicus TaxID=1389935 RepID=UPI0028AC83C7|nr:hypothetical protein [Achromobacter animicus]